MRVPVSWLKEYVDWQGGVEELAELLTMSGTEVEGVEWVGAPRDSENLARFVVGRVATRDKHPNADRLNLCTVDVGAAHGGVRQIVCGAHNFSVGDTVAVSLAGAVLESGLKLKKSAIRGVESDGMMMSERELGYEEDSPGIAILPAEWEVGAPLQDYLPVSEAVLEVELTSNRPDCFSIYGIAREVAAASGAPLAPPPIAAPATLCGAPAEDAIRVEIADQDLCSRYAARVIRNLVVGESPAWLKARLTHAGMRPINNVVDVTNYVMLGWGQPLHAFDAGKIGGGTLIARRAKDGEQIVTLDGVRRTLDGEMCVIADVAEPLVIAGVFGAIDAEVDGDTTHVVLEAANFSGPSILRTEMHTGIRSEASNRFEKGLDPQLVPGGLDFACRLFAELCGGEVAPGIVDVHGELPQRRTLAFRPSKCAALLGYTVPEDEQVGILRRLECAVVEPDTSLAEPAVWEVTVPTFRPDLEREVDLIEEVGRIAGYARAPETLPRHTTFGGLTKVQQVRRAVRRAVVGCGLDEVITYTFVAPDAVVPLGFPEGDVRLNPVRLSNPMSVEQSVMRTSLLPGLLTTVRDNLARLNEPPNLVELGRVYLWDEQASPAPPHAAEPGVMLPHELEAVGMVVTGPARAHAWTGAARTADFYTLKGVVEALLAALDLDGRYELLGESAGCYPYLHPGKSAVVSAASKGGGQSRDAGINIGVLGQLRADVAAAYGLDELDVYTATIDLDRLATVALPAVRFEDLGAYPPASQDLAVVVARDVLAADVVAVARRAGGKITRDVHVFDVYEGDQVPADKRSLALRVSMRSAERTLSDKDIAGVRTKIVAALAREFDAALR
ncbi:MAG: phenylalanine--tRNA ligase subunit beta [Thermoleophilia bacterium]